MATIQITCRCKAVIGTMTVPDVIPAYTPPASPPPPLPTDPFLIKMATSLAACDACAAVAQSKRTR